MTEAEKEKQESESLEVVKGQIEALQTQIALQDTSLYRQLLLSSLNRIVMALERQAQAIEVSIQGSPESK